jgi:hypothetical protein
LQMSSRLSVRLTKSPSPERTGYGPAFHCFLLSH